MASGKVVRYFLETTNTGDPPSGNRVVTEGERRQYGKHGNDQKKSDGSKRRPRSIRIFVEIQKKEWYIQREYRWSVIV